MSVPNKKKPEEEKKVQELERTVSQESYNPFEHRQMKKKTSDLGALAHLLKTSLGSGILAVPMAIKNAGLILGGISTIIIGIICTHCVQMLIASSQLLCKKVKTPELGYPETGEVAFQLGPEKTRKWAKGIKIIITVQLLLSFILGNTVYVVFMSETLRQFVSYQFHFEINIRYIMLGLWIPLIIMCLMRTLKSLVPFSILANILVAISFSITLYYIFREIHPPKDVNLVSPYERWPFFLTGVVFSLEGIGMVMSIENEMENPSHLLYNHKKCCGILYIAMTIVVSIYAIVGFFGYLQYGEATQGSITLNLPIEELLADAVKLLIAVAIFFTYALQFYVPINIIRNLCIDGLQRKNLYKEKHYLYIDLSVRIVMVSLTIIAAMLIPKLEIIISIVGGLCFAMLGLTFPPLIDTVVRSPNHGRLKWRLVKNIFIIIFSAVIVACGFYGGILGLLEEYK